jgi:bifunctional non-homologous end joining protein LigD
VSDDASVILPIEKGNARVVIGEREVRVTNLEKVYFPESGITKGDLLQYYAAIAPALLPHLTDRAMVMKRYPNGIEGDFFFMKRAPTPRPDWIELCTVDHGNGNIIDFPIVQDMAALLWVVNLGCIDLNPWYARCADYNRPDFLHFDLDPVVGAEFDRVRATALLVKNALDSLGMQSYPKTTGSKGIHIYVPIRQGPLQKQVWTFAKSLAQTLEQHDPALVTAEYRIAKRPHGRVLVDYNQNAWGRTLSSVYSVRPRPGAPVSTPVTWEEIENGVAIDDFNIFNVPARVAELGDLWAPVVDPENRFDLERYL